MEKYSKTTTSKRQRWLLWTEFRDFFYGERHRWFVLRDQFLREYVRSPGCTRFPVGGDTSLIICVSIATGCNFADTEEESGMDSRKVVSRGSFSESSTRSFAAVEIQTAVLLAVLCTFIDDFAFKIKRSKNKAILLTG